MKDKILTEEIEELARNYEKLKVAHSAALSEITRLNRDNEALRIAANLTEQGVHVISGMITKRDERRLENIELRAEITRLESELAGRWIPSVRTAVANYMYSEGCSCCQDTDAHKAHEAALAELLSVTPYEDGSGYEFNKYRTAPPAPN